VSPAWPLDRPDAVLLDIDGTLVDSNYLHVFAWSDAFREVDHPVPAWKIHRAIGMDSSKLLAELLGGDAGRLGKAAKAAHSLRYAALGDSLRVLPGGRELVAKLADEGVKVVLATSAPPGELEVLRRLLDVEPDLTAVTAGDDVDTAKPAPDIVSVALDKAQVAPERALFVGDSVWDVQAAGQAGVRCVGLRSGGISAAELFDAGAIAVYDDPAALGVAVGGNPWLARL
jgi:HAD superfamily hydrolase (TIGR01509 family)